MDRMSRREYHKQTSVGVAFVLLVVALIAAVVALSAISGLGCLPANVAYNAAGGDGDHAGLRISEIMTSNSGAYPNEEGKFVDWVELWNTTDHDMNLQNTGLSNRSDRLKFFFPDYVLPAGGRVIVFCDNVNRSEAGDVFHAKFNLSSMGCSVFLFDSSGRELEHVDVPILNEDESYILTLADPANGIPEDTYSVTDDYSPLFPNTFDGHAAFLESFRVDVSSLVINEVCAAPRANLLPDADGDLSDWIEIRNLSDRPISLANYALSDDPAKRVKWSFPENAVIPANGYYLVFASGKNKVEEGTYFAHTNFSLRADGETITLSTITGELVDQVTYETMGKDVSYGRDYDTLQWKIFTMPTPTLPNTSAGIAKADEVMRANNKTRVIITELMSGADKTQAISGLAACDWVEIHNPTDAVVDLSGWGLSDNVNWPRKWQFPQGTQIWPGEYKVVLLDKSASAGTDASQLHASFALSRAGGEMMTLSDPQGNVLDRIYIPALPTDVSYGRTEGAAGFFYYSTATPGRANADGFVGYAEAPSFTVESGLYTGEIVVGINVPEGTTVRYTTDGSVPTLENSEVYTAPFLIQNNLVLRARAYRTGLQASDPITATYIMNTYHTVRVVSLVVDPYELWNPNTGMLADGPDAVKEPGKLPFKHTVYREFGKIARPGYVEVFEQGGDKTTVISQGVKVSLLGDYSLDMPQKSFKIRAQASSGHKYFEYPLFEDALTPRDYSFYKSFTLRNSGNDCVWTRLVDGFQTVLVERYVDTNIISLAWQPTVVYLNGAFYGHYNMRERKDRYCIAQHEGLDLEKVDDITILRASGSVVQGTNTEWRAMVNTLKTMNPGTNASDRAYLDANVDIDNYLDWFAIEMFFGNSDPGNILFYRLPTPGAKWKCLLFDLDYGMFNSAFDSPWSYMKPEGMGQQKINNVIFRKILEVPEYQELFYTKIGNIYKNLTVDRMMSTLDELYRLIEPEMEWHFKLWAVKWTQETKLVNSDSPSSADGLLRYWNTRIRRLQNVISKRPYYIYTLFQKQYGLSNAQMEYYFGSPCPPKPAD